MMTVDYHLYVVEHDDHCDALVGDHGDDVDRGDGVDCDCGCGPDQNDDYNLRQSNLSLFHGDDS